MARQCVQTEQNITVIFSSSCRYWKLPPPPQRELERPPNKTVVKSSTYDLQPRCRVPLPHLFTHLRDASWKL